MAAPLVAIQKTGLVTSVGLTAPAACAAIRAKLTNPGETRFIDSAGAPILAHQVPLDQPLRGIAKLVRMAAMAIEECLDDVPREQWGRIPLLLCVAERERTGRLDGMDDRLFLELESALGTRFPEDSAVIARGRVGAAIALAQARKLIHERRLPGVLIAAADSLLNWPTLSHYERADRLLTARNSNGFMPGEGAGAVLVTEPRGGRELLCTGLGFAMEKAFIDSGEPLRGDGLTAAVKAALADAGCQMHDLDFRVTDLSGEQYYFKEASLALNRILRVRKEDFQLWHPAESHGEAGAASGMACLVVAHMAAAKGYAPGRMGLLHFAADEGHRAALTIAGGH